MQQQRALEQRWPAVAAVAAVVAMVSLGALVAVLLGGSASPADAVLALRLRSAAAPPAVEAFATMDSARQRFGELYRLYADELRDLHVVMKAWCKERHCLSDDLEVETTYMRVRTFKPTTVWEASPHHGFTTMILLTALKQNGFGNLHSFDIADKVTKNIPSSLSQGRWQFHEGDFRTAYLEHLKSSRPDYLFLDSFHSYEFGKFYTTELFPALGVRHLPVSLHDVYNVGFWNDHRSGRDVNVYPAWMPNEEGLVVIDWLKDQQHVCGTFSLARARTEAQESLHRDVHIIRAQVLGKGSGIRGVDGVDPTLFFELNC